MSVALRVFSSVAVRVLIGAVAGTVLSSVSPGVAAALPPSCSQSSQTVTCNYTSGSNPFTAPSGVSSIRVVAVGGRGGKSVLCALPAGCSDDQAGGFGARVSAGLAISPGSTVYAVPGVNGAPGAGGPFGGFSGAGGGASDVRVSPNDASTRLLVAAGGGGAGASGLIAFGTDHASGGTGAQGGAAGADGVPGGPASWPSDPAGAGHAGGSQAGGAGGVAGVVTNIANCSPACVGGPGAPGVGGAGGAGGIGGGVGEGGHVFLSGGNGGGGGDGLFGGGGGGGGSPAAGGAGGGGGSNLVPTGGLQSIDTTGSPMVQISYIAPRESTRGCVVFGEGRITASDGDRASFSGLAVGSGPAGIEVYRDDGPAHAFRVVSSTVAAVTCNAHATKASVFGSARIDRGALVDYQIDIRLGGRRLRSATYRVRLSDGTDSGIQPVHHGVLGIRLRR